MPTPTTLTSDPLNFVLAGYVNSGSLNNVGGGGFLWSPVVCGSDLAYRGGFDSGGGASPGSDDDRYAGQSVRCVAR